MLSEKYKIDVAKKKEYKALLYLNISKNWKFRCSGHLISAFPLGI